MYIQEIALAYLIGVNYNSEVINSQIKSETDLKREIRLIVPLVPPGVNHYVKHTRRGHHYVTSEALAFKEAICLIAAGRFVVARKFEVEAVIYLGFGQKGDVDGFPKLVMDGLAKAGMFRKVTRSRPIPTPISDAHVSDLIVRRRRDNKNPRTEIVVREARG